MDNPHAKHAVSHEALDAAEHRAASDEAQLQLAYRQVSSVFGISARNAILLLSYYEQIVEKEELPWNEATIVRGANERLNPILMTAVLTALGLAPLAASIVQPGQEISGPMAVTVLGGLASSTILNLVLMPALAARFSRRDGGDAFVTTRCD